MTPEEPTSPEIISELNKYIKHLEKSFCILSDKYDTLKQQLDSKQIIWFPVSEKPEKGPQYLVHVLFEWDGHYEVWSDTYLADQERWMSFDGRVPHWAYLPEGPKEKAS